MNELYAMINSLTPAISGISILPGTTQLKIFLSSSSLKEEKGEEGGEKNFYLSSLWYYPVNSNTEILYYYSRILISLSYKAKAGSSWINILSFKN